MLQAFLSIPRLRLAKDIDFLVDTGSDRTTLSPDDGECMGIDYDDLMENPYPSVEIDGIDEGFIEPARLMFEVPDQVTYVYFIPLYISKPAKHREGLPSILGRSVFHNWHTSYLPPSDSLTFQVKTADRIIPLTR